LKTLAPISVLILCLAAAGPSAVGAVAADPSSGAVAAAPPVVPVLAPVTVRGLLDIQARGTSVISQEVIERLPRGNGGVNELLGILPDVQLDATAQSSKTGGEILPPDVSISGGKAFQNYFAIDGFSNNSLLDPTFRNPENVSDVPGHPQEFFLDASLAEEVVVYDSNIPARFGNFSGGVVDMRTRSAGSRPGGYLGYRHTRDDWTRFHLQDAERYDFSRSDSARLQPSFEKHLVDGGFSLPLGPNQGLLVDAHLVYSRIPLQLLGATEAQSRSNQNLFVKYSRDLSGDRFLDLTLIYAPYRGDYFLPDTLNSGYRIEGGGLGLQAGFLQLLDQGDLRFRIGLHQSENNRRAPAEFRNWNATDGRPWGRIVGSPNSREGGFGDIDKTQRRLELGAEVNRALPDFAGAVQQLDAGVQYELLYGEHRRSEVATLYSTARISPDVICGGDPVTCIDGEQFFSERKIFDASKVSAEVNQLALFAEDRLHWERLMLRPGLRLSWDDFLGNLDAAPRLAAEYDLYGDGETLLLGGLNRYYGRSLLAFKLREAIQPPQRQYRTTFQNQVTDWVDDPLGLNNVARFSDLDTPYSDEVVAGVDQLLFGGRLSSKLVLRFNREEFVRKFGPVQPDGLRYFTMSNGGSSRHRSLRFSWEKTWPGQTLLVSYTLQDDSRSEDDLLAEEELQARVWYGNQIVYKSELPVADLGPPQIAKLLYTAKLPGGFGFTNVAQWRSSFRHVENTLQELEVPADQRRFDPVSGVLVEESLDVYAKVRHASVFLVDWKLTWQAGPAKPLDLVLSLEVDNLLDRKIETATSPGTFLLGRQFWAGAECRF